MSVPNPRLIACGLGVLAASGLIAMLTPAHNGDSPRVLAACNDTVDTTDSFSMNCVPTMIPDMSDQLTEAEVAQPGWNAGSSAVPGGGGHH